MRELNCTFCNSIFSFESKRGRPPSFCSERCKLAALTDKRRYCRVCRKQFQSGGFYCSPECHTTAQNAYINSRPNQHLRTAATLKAHKRLPTTDHNVIAWTQAHQTNAAKFGFPVARNSMSPYTNIPLETLETFKMNGYMQNGLDIIRYVAANYAPTQDAAAWLAYISLIQPLQPGIPGMRIPRGLTIWPWITATSEDPNPFTLNTYAKSLILATNSWRSVTVNPARTYQVKLIQRAVSVRKAWLQGTLDALSNRPSSSERFRREWLVPSISFYDEDRPDSFSISKIQMFSIPIHKNWWPHLDVSQHSDLVLRPALHLSAKQAANLARHSYEVESALTRDFTVAMRKANKSKNIDLSKILVPDDDPIAAGKFRFTPEAKKVNLKFKLPWSDMTFAHVMDEINTYSTGDIEAWTDWWISTARYGGLNCDNAKE